MWVQEVFNRHLVEKYYKYVIRKGFLMEFFIYVLLVFGITNIVVRGSIFDSFRDWLEKKSENIWFFKKISTLVNCPMCFGFWAGAFVGFFYGPFDWWNILFNGGVYSATTWIIWLLLQRVEGDS